MTVRFTAFLICVLALSCGRPAPVCGAPVQTPDAARAAMERLFEEYWEAKLRHSPVWATYIGDHRYDDRIDDYSEEHRQWWLKSLGELLGRLNAIDLTRCADEDRLNADLFRRVLTEELELGAFPEHLMPLKQQQGPHITLPMIQLSHPFNTPQDYANYATRLRAFSVQAEQVIDRMREGIQRGVVLPRLIAAKVLPQLRAHVVADPTDSELYKPLNRLPDAFTPQQRRQAAERIADAIREAAVPGYRRLEAFLSETYLPACRDTLGYCHLPDGQAWYRRLARHHTTTDLSPEECHRIGLREMDRIHDDMRQIVKRVGFDGDLEAFIADLRSRPDLHAASADELIAGHAAILARSDPLLPRLFGRLPKAAYELKEIESFRAPAAPIAFYYPPPEDGSRPAFYYVNTYQPHRRAKYTMEALAYHEAMPGHHLQIALAQENVSLPRFRRYADFSVFVEGWGLYSELLGKEIGGYRDPYSDFGRLTFDVWRAARLVVDTGIHYFGWDRQRAVDYMRHNTALAELNIESEVDRYVAWPGQALAYKIGQLEILDLRRKAEAALGDRFDIRAFHDELLGRGAIPLDILRSRMQSWIASQKRPAGQ